MTRWNGIQLKHLKIGPLEIRLHIGVEDLSAIAIIGLGIFIRLLLLTLGWPHTTMDEGTMGQMAVHIADQGQRPIFFYGQPYMGALEAYIAAVLFPLFGASLFTLRLGLVFIFTIFLIGMYLLVSLLYTKKLALFSILLLALGASIITYREMQAIGGYPETLMFAALAFLLASWLAISARQPMSPGRRIWRLVAYFGWGLVAGLGLWSDLLIIPCLAISGLLLLLFCWRELRSLAPLCLLLGLIIGVMPLIIYAVQVGDIQKTLSTVIFIYQGRTQHPSWNRLLPQTTTGAFLVGLPTTTSYSPVCFVESTFSTLRTSHSQIACVVGQGAWSLGAIILWISAVLLALGFVWQLWRHTPSRERSVEQQQDIIRSCARLSILFMAGAYFLLFAISPTAANLPYLNARYLICILIAIPSMIYPLWKGAGMVNARMGKSPQIIVRFKQAALAFIALIFLLGTLGTFGEVPATQAMNQQQNDLVSNLLHAGIHHIYSDFWSCDRIIFQSNEQIVCSVLNDQLQLAGDRYRPNGTIVQSDPQSSYVLPIGSPMANGFQKHFANSGRSFQRMVFDGYVVYRPD